MHKAPLTSSITKFYANKSVLITGATGTVGKFLLEKLLFACRDVNRVFVMVQKKKGVSAAQRVDSLIKSHVFTCEPYSAKCSEEKIVPIYGDLTMAGLGLSVMDRRTAINEMSVVINCAASIRLDGPMKEALEANFLGPRSMTELCNEMSKLEAYVQVSTCYSNSHLGTVEEKIYPTKITGEELMKLSATMHDRAFDKMAKKLYEGRPSSYTFSKALAEKDIYENSKRPTAIARLSVVAPALYEPQDTATGLHFAMLAQFLGNTRTIKYERDGQYDILPVDVVANGLLAIAHDVATTKPEKPRVYNVAAGVNASTPSHVMFQANDLAIKDSVSLRSVRPSTSLAGPTSTLEFLYKKYILEYAYALVADILNLFRGKKMSALKDTMFMSNIRNSQDYFYRTNVDIRNSHFDQVGKNMDEASRQLFNLDLKAVAVACSSVEEHAKRSEHILMSLMKYKLGDTPSIYNTAERVRHFYSPWIGSCATARFELCDFVSLQFSMEGEDDSNC